MKTVRAYIAEKQSSFAQHPLFARFERNAPLAEVLPFISTLSFWAVAFQDVIRINESKVKDPQLRRLARQHRAEDAGHDKWFLSDLLKIEGCNPDVRSLFGAQHAATRDASYALMSEAFRAQEDVERIALVLALESTGHIFFEAIASYFERMGVTQSLQYFARKHVDVELAHEMFEQEINAYIDGLQLTEVQRASMCALVDRVYEAFFGMFDGFEDVCARAEARPADDCADRLLAHEAASGAGMLQAA